MKVHYDEEVDALYLKFGDQEPDGVVGVAEGVNIDTTIDGKLTGIEILKASGKINLDTILSYTLELKRNIAERIRIDCVRNEPQSYPVVGQARCICIFCI